jgi:hypothetical protein
VVLRTERRQAEDSEEKEQNSRLPFPWVPLWATCEWKVWSRNPDSKIHLRIPSRARTYSNFGQIPEENLE